MCRIKKDKGGTKIKKFPFKKEFITSTIPIELEKIKREICIAKSNFVFGAMNYVLLILSLVASLFLL